jgi:hypothetical protein
MGASGGVLLWAFPVSGANAKSPTNAALRAESKCSIHLLLKKRVFMGYSFVSVETTFLP